MPCTCTYTPTVYGFGGLIEEPAYDHECAECYEARIMREFDEVDAEFEVARERELEATF